MEKADVSRWLDDYVQAWKSYDRDAIGALFSDDVSYRYHPYDEPIRGREAVGSSWFGKGEGDGASRDDPGTYDAGYLPVAVDGDVAVATGRSTLLRRPHSRSTRSSATSCVDARRASSPVSGSSRPNVPYRISPSVRSGKVAANDPDIAPPPIVPKCTARSDPAASITARTSSIRSARVGSSSGATRSDRPVPRLSKRISRESSASRRRKRASGWTSQARSRCVTRWTSCSLRHGVGAARARPRPGPTVMIVDPQNPTRVGLLMDVPDMDAVMAAMETEAAAEAMAHDGVVPETLVILVEA